MAIDDPKTASVHRYLRVALIAVAAWETLDALSSASNIFTDYHHETQLLKFMQGMTSVKLALAPFIAGAALVLAALRRVRGAILALAALALVTFVLDTATDIPLHGFEITPDVGGLVLGLHNFGLPALALVGGWLAWKDRQLAPAGLFVCLPTLFNWTMIAIFTISIVLNGF